MASEILTVPEESLEEVIRVIRAGLGHTRVSSDTRRNLKKWCDEEEKYLKSLQDDQ